MSDSPATFLFTDIEGSTRLWEAHPEAMREALVYHDDLLRACIESHDGRVFKTVGDAFCARFASAAEALRAALAAQRWLEQVEGGWLRVDGAESSSCSNEMDPSTRASNPAAACPQRDIRVRMALHTGAAEERDGDYYGPTLNRMARLLAAGHGGQVLLSGPAREAVAADLPDGASLQDRGSHRLRDLQEPLSVFQLLHPELPADFPPLRSLPTHRNNLPQQVTSFIGREREMEEVKRLLGATRLLTLTGSGGCGKTRLALQVASDLIEGYPDGVWLVELAPLTDPAFVSQTVATALRVEDGGDRSPAEVLVEHLKEKRLVLLLDNCEHLLAACASLADTLLRQCPGVRLLASSREGLNIVGEQVYGVPSLGLPHDAATPDGVRDSEAGRLFLDRAMAVQAGFRLTDQNAGAVASICGRLDGIPLAIELAAVRVKLLSPPQLLGRLDDRFRLLTGGSRTALPRQQTLRALIDWSFDLLNDAEKALLCCLSVFAGGWTLEAAEEVCGCVGAQVPGCGTDSETATHPHTHTSIQPHEVLDLLTSLVDKSLVVSEAAGAATRFHLLETVRQYARDRLLESGEGERWRDRHRDHFLAVAEEAEPNLVGPEQATWLHRLEAEHDNFRAALEWALAAPDACEAGLRICAALWRFWEVKGHLGEGRLGSERALLRTGGRTAHRARALNGAGNLAANHGDHVTARRHHEESLAIRRELGDRWGIAASLNNLANALDDVAEARPLLEECLEIWRELGDHQGMAASLTNLANAAAYQGDYAGARSLHAEVLVIRRELGDRRGIAASIGSLGAIVCMQNEYAKARSLLEEALVIRRELGDRWGIAVTLEWLASAAAGLGEAERAVRLWGSAQLLREAIGSPLGAADRQLIEPSVAAARAALGDDEAFDKAWLEGRAMSWERAVKDALAESSDA